MLLWALTPRLSEWIHESLHVRIQENILQCKIYIHQVSNVNFGNLRFLYPSLRHVTATSVTSTRLFNTSLRDKFVTPTRHFETNSSLRHVTSTLCHFDKSLRQKSYILASSTVFFLRQTMMYEMAESLIDAIFEALLISKRCTKKERGKKI